MQDKVVLPKPIGKLSIWRKILKHIPGFCSYCGKRFVPCHSKDINLWMPVPQNGKCCPDGHEGYTVMFTGFAEVIQWFDFVEKD